jgi:hypothetical protein
MDPIAYGKLLASELPRPIQNDREFGRMVARLEELDFSKQKLTREEKPRRSPKTGHEWSLQNRP